MNVSKKINTVTPLSKTLALVIFITAPIFAFFYGRYYESLLTKHQENYALQRFDKQSNELEHIISQKPRDRVIQYTVIQGDTLEKIAEKFNITTDTVRWANNINPALLERPGTTLNIPPTTGIVHQVKTGETVYSLSQEYHVDPEKIMNFPFNDFKNLETFDLTPGQLLYIPDGIK